MGNAVVWSGTIYGQPYSAKNRRKFVTFGTRPASIKSDEARAYYESALLQIERERMAPALPIEVDLELSGTIFCHSRRPDFVGCVDPICDILQRGRVIHNDRQIKAFGNLGWALDKERPRAEIVLRSLVA
jgi:Holliday junction resolvase RusA-like endonuclease